MIRPEKKTIFHEVADTITLAASRYPNPAARKIRRAAKLLVEAGDMIERLPEGQERHMPPEDFLAVMKKRGEIENSNTPFQDMVWALEKFQARFPRPISRKLSRASKLLTEASEVEG